MSILVATLQGRFGNQATQWLFAYAFAQKHAMEFQCDEWVGERIFDLPKYGRPTRRDLPRFNENTIFEPCLDLSKPWFEDREFRGYAQCQRAMIYTKRQAQSWLKLRPEIEAACKSIKLGVENNGPIDIVVCHRRVGDYAGYSYPIVSERSYHFAMAAFGIDLEHFKMLTEERPTNHAGLPNDLPFLADFYRMMTAPTLLRGNSTFSWLAALLGNGLVLSPVIDGLEGGKEHDVKFVAGNHPRLANFDFTTDLYISP